MLSPLRLVCESHTAYAGSAGVAAAASRDAAAVLLMLFWRPWVPVRGASSEPRSPVSVSVRARPRLCRDDHAVRQITDGRSGQLRAAGKAELGQVPWQAGRLRGRVAQLQRVRRRGPPNRAGRVAPRLQGAGRYAVVLEGKARRAPLPVRGACVSPGGGELRGDHHHAMGREGQNRNRMNHAPSSAIYGCARLLVVARRQRIRVYISGSLQAGGKGATMALSGLLLAVAQSNSTLFPN